MNIKNIALLYLISIAVTTFINPVAQASSWAAVGDMKLRNDVEILARYNIITGPVNSWPLSWEQISDGLETENIIGLPAFVKAALYRVKAKIPPQYKISASIRLTNQPDLIRSFNAAGRADLDASLSFEIKTPSGLTAHIEGGYRKNDKQGKNYAHLDGSYISQDLGNWSLYGGLVDRWWGTGRTGSLLLSNSARPMPSIGLRRIKPEAFENKWFNWMGPWSWDMFVAKMEKDRFIPNTLIAGMRLSFEPIKNFEVGFARILQLCGDNRPCNFKTWAHALISVGELDNSYNGEPEPGNQLASIDLAYSFPIGETTTLKLYAEGTAEDQNVIMPFQFARLMGFTLYGAHGNQGNHWRAGFEYTDTANTLAWIVGKRRFGTIYHHHIYRSGYKYEGESIGHSLFNDTRLFTISLSYNDSEDWGYNIKYHNAFINMDGLSSDIKTAGQQPIHKPAKYVNIIEGTIQKSFSNHSFEIGVYYMRSHFILPIKSESQFSVELTWKINFGS